MSCVHSQRGSFDLKKKQFHDNFSNLPLAPQNGDRPGVYNPRRRSRRLFRCSACETKNATFCQHCFLCGSTEHRKQFCNKKNE